jgi:hypothetical protein
MQAYRPDRVVRALTALVSVAYFVAAAGAAVVLVAAPLARLMAARGDAHWVWALPLPASPLDAEATVRTSWGAARLVAGEVRGDLLLPIVMLPWWLVAVLWTYAAVALGLGVLSLHELRRIFQRVRDGAPFDADNASRVRRLGVLLLALALLDGVAGLVTSLAVRGELVSGGLAVATGLRVNVPLVVVALVLVALAEIFRRGAELETEQALVV